MTISPGASWDDFLTNCVKDIRIAFGLLMEAAVEPAPVGHLADTIQLVLSEHPRITPIVLGRYGHLLSQSELTMLSEQFPEAKVFLDQFSRDIEAMRELEMATA